MKAKVNNVIMAWVLLFFCAFFICPQTNANNIRILKAPKIMSQDTTNNTVKIVFDLAWDNSWRTTKPANWDAAWIFVKAWDGQSWNHVYLDTTGNVAGDPTASDYKVEEKNGGSTTGSMLLEYGFSRVQPKWGVDPTESYIKGCVGVFLYRKNLGSGNVVVKNIALKWNYGKQGFVDDDELVVKVFAVEMVYVPQGAYYLGGTGTAAKQTYSFTNGTAFGTPRYVTNEDAITVVGSPTDQKLSAIDGGMTAGTIPARFPKGYKAFYVMKYELTQEAYADFLNTLEQGQQNGRTQVDLNGVVVGNSIWDGAADALDPYRNYLCVIQSAPTVLIGVDANHNNIYNETQVIDSTLGIIKNIDGQDIAVNFVSMYDLLAYADFSGLRPMTELEYEKACRGSKKVNADEFAWGSSTLVYFNASFHSSAGAYSSMNTTTFKDINTGTEKPMPIGYNAGATHGGTHVNGGWWSGGWYVWTYSAPLRVGCFADSNTSRSAAGASYWGIMNLSDNVSELCVRADNVTGRAFVGVHGDGQLMFNGNANIDSNLWNYSDAAAYYIPRGMIFPYNCVWGSDYLASYGVGANTTISQNLEAGRVSSRAAYPYAVTASVRESASFMSGIRCVRTSNAEK
ncbi:MAG: SUMF1/EgtB/PvdO family nonheme iron enzyme [Bacteroidales bacterium]